MNVIRKIDNFFLSRFEKVMHKLQRLTGKTNFYFAGMLGFFVVIIMVGGYYRLFPEGLLGQVGEGFVLSLLSTNPALCLWAVVTCSLLSACWKFFENQAYDQLNVGCSNPLKNNLLGVYVRLQIDFIWLPLLLVELFFLAIPTYDRIFLYSVISIVFLISCDPLPACKSKALEWLKGFGNKPALVPIPIKTKE
jgi:hypothetical protein